MTAGASLEAAGVAQQDAVFQFAVTLGIGIPLLPILTILAIWLIPRIMFIRRAGRAKQVVTAAAGMDLLALRALTTQKLAAIAKIDADALGAWRRGEPDVVRRLAQLELRSSECVKEASPAYRLSVRSVTSTGAAVATARKAGERRILRSKSATSVGVKHQA